MGEHYKNYLERYVPYLLGGSAVISGSGMATESVLYQAYLASPEIEQGQHQWKKMLQEDKILQNFLIQQNKRIAYARNAVVYDEKTRAMRWKHSAAAGCFPTFKTCPTPQACCCGDSCASVSINSISDL